MGKYNLNDPRERSIVAQEMVEEEWCKKRNVLDLPKLTKEERKQFDREVEEKANELYQNLVAQAEFLNDSAKGK